MEKNRISIEIGGKTYCIAGERSEEYLFKVANYVKKQLAELNQKYPTMSTTDAGILVALNISDELFSREEPLPSIDRQIDRVMKEKKDKRESMLPKLPQLPQLTK